MYGAILSIFKAHIKQFRHTYQSASACRILFKSDHPRQSYDVISLFKTAATASQFYFRFPFSWLCSDGKVGIYLHGKISAWYLNPRLRYYYFGFMKTNVRHVWILLPVPIFYICVTVSMSFCICLPNFVQIRELSRHIHFSTWRPQHRNSTFGFGFRDFAHLGRSKYTCIPNFGEISQSTAEILLLSVSENKRPPCWNSTSGSNFYVCVTIGMLFCICLPNFVQIGSSVTEL